MRVSLVPLLALVALGPTSCDSPLPPAVQTKSAPTPSADAEAPAASANLDAIVWMQRAGTYEAACQQAYNQARARLEQSVSDASWSALPSPPEGHESLPPAVIVDVDETVLDNSPYQARLALDVAEHSPERWHEWVEERSADPIPGALEFARFAESKGVVVFYVTNRKAEHREATRANLAAAGFPMAEDREVVLTREDSKDKEPRRRAIATTHRVLLLIGDQLGDFTTVGENADRVGFARERASEFGTRWILIPNPAYGEWLPNAVADRRAALASKPRGSSPSQ